MSIGVLIMYAIAGLLALTALALFLRLRASRSEPARYAGRIAGTMSAAGGAMLFAYATALWRWSAEV